MVAGLPGKQHVQQFWQPPVDDEAALLFIDFATGATVQVTGTAQVRWTNPGGSGDDGGVGRRVALSVSAVVALAPNN
jgi:uncharacterized protein